MSESVSVGLRLPKKTLNELDKVAEEAKLDRSAITRQLLAKGLQEFKKERAINLYRQGKATFSKAAEAAGLTVWEFEQLLVQNGVISNYSLEDLKKELNQ